MRKTAICKECKENKKILGRGLCAKCYKCVQRAGELDKYPPGRPGRPGRKASKEAAPPPNAPHADIEAETEAIKLLFEALRPLNSDTRESVIDYVCNRLAAGENKKRKTSP